jgi:hypothetical protein
MRLAILVKTALDETRMLVLGAQVLLGLEFLVETGGDTGRFHQLISRTADYALLPFALSLGLALFIAGEIVFGFSAGAGSRRPSRSRMLVRAPISAAAANRS